jgi:hypothetical protein
MLPQPNQTTITSQKRVFSQDRTFGTRANTTRTPSSGKTQSPSKHMEQHNRRRVGPLCPVKGIQNAIYKPTTAMFSSEGTFQSSSFIYRTATHQEGDSELTMQERNKRDSQRLHWVSLPIVYYSQEDRGTSSSAEPPSIESIHISSAFQDEITEDRTHHKINKGDYLDQHRFSGRFSICARSSIYSSFLAVHNRRKAVPVWSLSIQTPPVPPGVHQSVTSSLTLGTSQRYSISAIWKIC